MSKKTKHPLDALCTMYKKMLKKQDKKGFSEIYKGATEAFFENVNQEMSEYSKENSITHVTFTDVNYLDGYFVFAYGTNSVVHFHVKEIPGWLFGIWWDEPKLETLNNGKSIIKITGTLFTQYEDEIDKFKPSRSELQCQLNVSYNEENHFGMSVYSVFKLLTFIYREPELAFCRDYCGWDYNEEYHSRAEAEKEFRKYKAWFTTKEEQTKLLDERMVAKINEIFKGEIADGNAILGDRGEEWSPRYEMFVNKDKYDEWKDTEPGLYGLDGLISKEDVKNFKKEEKACSKVSDKYKFFWFTPVSDCVTLLENKKFNQLKKSIAAEKALEGKESY